MIIVYIWVNYNFKNYGKNFIGIKIKCQKKIDKKTAKTPINKEFRAK